MRKRKLKVQSKTVQKKPRGYTEYPSIKLEGLWLQEVGFSPADYADIEVKKNKIIITKT